MLPQRFAAFPERTHRTSQRATGEATSTYNAATGETTIRKVYAACSASCLVAQVVGGDGLVTQRLAQLALCLGQLALGARGARLRSRALLLRLLRRSQGAAGARVQLVALNLYVKIASSITAGVSWGKRLPDTVTRGCANCKCRDVAPASR